MNVLLLMVIIRVVYAAGGVDPQPESIQTQRQASGKSPFTVIIIGDAEELLHLNKQVKIELILTAASIDT